MALCTAQNSAGTIARCRERNVPTLAHAGVVEYHGPHLPIGTDFLIANEFVTEIEQRGKCMVLPPFTYSSTLSWAA